MPVTLEYCGLDRADQLMSFIRDHWSANHVLGNSRELFDWQHLDEGEKRYNFLLALMDGEIVGMLGFIPTARYDSSLSSGLNALWLTTWKVRADYARGLGLHLLRTLTLRHPHAWIGTVGLNPATREIYELLGYRAGGLSRYFLLNDEIVSFELAVVPDDFVREKSAGGKTRFSIIDPREFLSATSGPDFESSRQTPAKTPKYLYERYLKHPFYRYQALHARNEDAEAVLIMRQCTHGGASAIRIVDFFGAPAVLEGAAGAFQRLLHEHGAEYLDFYCTGLDAELMSAGLRCQRDVAGLVLPGHFEPFEKENVDLLYALKGTEGRMIICKGDADQDRPNSLPLQHSKSRL